MARYLDELIEKYNAGEIDDESICDNITRITNKEEYINDVNENRKKTALANKYAYLKYDKSPEDIIIGWEEDEMILHFISWIKSILPEKDWFMFKSYTLGNITHRQLGRMVGKSENATRKKMSQIRKKINRLIPSYTEQFGDIKEYLRH